MPEKTQDVRIQVPEPKGNPGQRDVGANAVQTVMIRPRDEQTGNALQGRQHLHIELLQHALGNGGDI